MVAPTLVMFLAVLCSLATNSSHELDPQASADNTPPSAAVVENVTVGRYESSDGCGSIASCGDRGTIMFDLSATDDSAPPDKIGYRITVAGGSAPRDLFIDDRDIRTDGGTVFLYFDYDAPAFDMTLEVRSIDLNGNLGPPTLVQIADRPADSGGCVVGRSRVPGALFAAGALAFALRRRGRGGRGR